MNIVLDNIIFSLQHTGGISVVWREFLQRATVDSRLNLILLEYPADNVQRSELTISDSLLIHPPKRFMERYRTPLYHPKQQSVFHSSYFRVLDDPHAINVTTVHDLTYHYYRHGLPKAVHLAQERYALRHSKAVICISEATKCDLLHFYPFLNEENIRVIYNGLSPLYSPSKSPNVTVFDSGEYLLYVGSRDADYKNFGVAVEIARITRMPFVLAGPPLSSIESRLLDDLLGQNKWQHFSHVSAEQLRVLYSHAFCLLYPSAYEGFGLPVIEAQACNCLPLIQRCSSLPEVAGKGAFIVDADTNLSHLAANMAQAVKSLCNGTVNKDELLELGRVNAKRFSWDQNYEQTIQLYQEITQNE